MARDARVLRELDPGALLEISAGIRAAADRNRARAKRPLGPTHRDDIEIVLKAIDRWTAIGKHAHAGLVESLLNAISWEHVPPSAIRRMFEAVLEGAPQRVAANAAAQAFEELRELIRVAKEAA